MTSDSLRARLNAYRGPAKAAAPATPVAAPSHQTESLYAKHPVTQADLSLPEYVALDFAANTHRSELLFFDIESTGLGSGEETYPFLIGAAGVTAASRPAPASTA